MSVATEFLKDSEPTIGDFETNVNYVIDNYHRLLKIYRIMQAQNEETRKKKEEAHLELEALRDREEQIRKSGRRLSPQEKMELEERKKYLMEVREEDDQIFINGEKMRYDQETRLILKHQKLFKAMDHLDQAGRDKLSVVAEVTSNIALWPTRKMMSATIKQTSNPTALKWLNKAKDVINNIPSSIAKQILKTAVNPKHHRPVEKKEKKIEINF